MYYIDNDIESIDAFEGKLRRKRFSNASKRYNLNNDRVRYVVIQPRRTGENEDDTFSIFRSFSNCKPPNVINEHRRSNKPRRTLQTIIYVLPFIRVVYVISFDPILILRSYGIITITLAIDEYFPRRK